MGDILIHIGENLNNEAQNRLETHVQNQKGVLSAAVSNNASHLMFVDFDHLSTTSTDILHSVTRQGLQAELVGL